MLNFVPVVIDKAIDIPSKVIIVPAFISVKNCDNQPPVSKAATKLIDMYAM